MGPRPVELTPEALGKLERASTATVTTQLLRRGYRSTFIQGLRPTRPDLRLAGYAFTLRYVPAREDVAFNATFDNRTDVQRLAVESVGPGDVLVIDGRSELGAATLGDILATRVSRRGAAGIVTDGCLRDSPGFADVELPVYYRAPHASVRSVAHHPVDMHLPIGCGGVLVMPGDIIVGDAEGVAVIPAAIAEEVAHDAWEQELAETWALEQVQAGQALEGVYPLGEERQDDYSRWRAQKEESE